MKKFELTDISKTIKHPLSNKDITLYQIRPLIDFTLINGYYVSNGDLGGWLEKESNLSQEGLCWIYDNCYMFDDAYRSGNSIGYGNSMQFGNSIQSGESHQYGDSRQYDNSRQYGTSHQYGTSIQNGFARHYDGIDDGTPDTLIVLKSPTSQRSITINTITGCISTGCFNGSSRWMISNKRDELPDDHWAFKLHTLMMQTRNLKTLKDLDLSTL